MVIAWFQVKEEGYSPSRGGLGNLPLFVVSSTTHVNTGNDPQGVDELGNRK